MPIGKATPGPAGAINRLWPWAWIALALGLYLSQFGGLIGPLLRRITQT